MWDLWFGMIGAPIFWSVFLLVIWITDEFGCRLGLGDNSVLGINLIHLLVLLASLVAGAGTAASGYVAYLNWRRIQSTPADQRDEYERGIERGRFMALLGMGFSALFLLVILYMTIPVFLLPACS
jgi:hypothetical protein